MMVLTYAISIFDLFRFVGFTLTSKRVAESIVKVGSTEVEEKGEKTVVNVEVRRSEI